MKNQSFNRRHRSHSQEALSQLLADYQQSGLGQRGSWRRNEGAPLQRHRAVHFGRCLRRRVEAWEIPPRYLLRDRDAIYGVEFTRRVAGLGLKQKLIAP